MKRSSSNFMLAAVLLIAAGCAGLAQAAVNLELVPGKVIYYTPAPSLWDLYMGNEKYTSDPEIVVLPNGWYVACHNTFGGGGDPARVFLYRSTDKGTTWNSLGSITGLSVGGSLFLHDGALYLMGREYILKSTDNGTSWTAPNTGVFGTGTSTSTPNNPVVLNNRIWSAAHARAQFAPVASNLLDGASWSWGSAVTVDTNWFGGRWQGWSEAQIVASAEHGVAVMPKIRGLPYTALIRYDPDTTARLPFDPETDFVELPGGEKKFGAAYDDVSGRFFILSNPVLPQHASDPKLKDEPEMIRNTAAVLSSRDLRNWKVEKIFLYSPNIDYESFQYFNFDFDGADMAIASRTAFDVGDSNKPPRGHDSNLITFHKLENFRNLVPGHVLLLDTANNQVLRYEKTQHRNAPLGSFALGSSFDGAALAAPDGFGLHAGTGEIYIREAGGRILRFDAAGNFLETVASSPVSFQTSALTVTQPSNGECSWKASGHGDWSEPLNWYYWGRPDTDGEIATFGSAVESARSITVEKPFTVKGFRFMTVGSCTFSGAGRFLLKADAGMGSFQIEKGYHQMQVPVVLGSDAAFQSEAGTALRFYDLLDLNGNRLDTAGGGRLRMDGGTLALNGGTLAVGGAMVYVTNSTVLFNGTLEFSAPEGFDPVPGDSFRILEGDFDESMFGKIVLPALEEGLGWDTSTLYSDGQVAVVRRIPESWMAEHELPADGSADFEDTDGDGMDNYSEWRAGTDPTDPLSFFKVVPGVPSPEGFTLGWNSRTGRTYRIEASTNLLAEPAFRVLRSGIPGETGTTWFADTNAPAASSMFYRAVVE